MVNEQEEIKLGYLLDPCFELSNTAGKPLTNGWIEVYIHGTRNKYYCYSDFGGTLHPFKIPLDSLGSNIVLADPERAYDVYVYNQFGSLVMSRYNVSPGHAGGAAISSGGNAEHWIGRYGATIEVAANEYSDSIPLPIEPDYEGTFIDHISDNKNIVLKDGLYLVDCLLSFRQNPDSLNNTLGYVHVFTGLDDGESGVFQRNETLPDTDPDETHNIRVQFVRHVEGSTGCNVCFQVRTTNAWSFVRIQGLSIVKLGAGGGIAPQPIEYDAGQYISIDNDVISVTGLQPAGNYADSDSVAEAFNEVAQDINTLSGQINEVSGQIPSLEGYATENWVNDQGFLKEVPSQYVTESELNSAVSGKADKSEIPSLEGYATEDWVQNQNYLTSVPDNYATDQEVQAAVSGKADKSEIPSLDGYATESFVQSAVSGKQDELEFTYDEDEKITSIDGHEIAGTGGSTYSAGKYVSIHNDIISVTGLQPSGEYLTSDDLNGYATEQWVGEQNFATVDDVDEATSGKLDSSAYQAPVNADWNSESGLSQILNKPEASQLIPGSGISIVPSGDNYIINSFGGGSTYSAGQYISIENETISVTGLQPSGEYLVPDDLNGYATTEDVEAATSGKADVSAIPSLQGYATESWVSQQGYLTEVPAGYATEEYVQSATSGKMDASEASAFYPMASNPSGYLTQHQSLAGYATEQYVQDQTSGFVDSGFVSQYVESEVSGKQDTLQFTYNEEDKISAINGSAIAGGSDVPMGVMVESGLQYNAVGEISGYGDSAIAQYGAEKQWLVHDDTIVHMSNSAQYAFGVNVSAVAQLMGIDETVIWQGAVSGVNIPIQLSESLNNFNKVKFILQMDDCRNEVVYDYLDNRSGYGLSLNNMSNYTAYMGWMKLSANETHDTLTITQAKNIEWNATTTATAPTGSRVNWEWTCRSLVKIIGIGRKQST